MPGSTALAEETGELIQHGFDAYQRNFLAVARRAKMRFERRDWVGGLADTRERLALYGQAIQDVVVRVTAHLESHDHDPTLWTAMRAAHCRLVLDHPAAEVAETFFNSVTRRIFHTVGTNPAIEYLDFHFERVAAPSPALPYRSYGVYDGLAAALARVLADCPFAVPYADAPGDTHLAAQVVAAQWESGKAPLPIDAFEILEAVFYRRKGAYLVGRARGGNRLMPLVLALVHTERGIAIDAALVTEAEVSMVFSFTRSYFHADVPRPADVTAFLLTLMPTKPVGELYISLGYHKHGKTELYRALQRHLARTHEKFERAPGARGTVMEVFTLPSFDVVFKVIRDHFPPSKQVTPEEVRQRYRMVFEHDRAGRLVDAQEFEGLTFPKTLFAPSLLEDLLASAQSRVRIEGDQVVIDHLYTERRVRPLDLYLADVDPHSAERAVLEYGQAIRDLAATGIFPGDLLLKNFGVTRHGRLVFYDYDELRLLDECRFLKLPEPRTPEEEMADEPWFVVGPNDIFAEELPHFLPFSGAVREAFLRAHGALYQPEFWRDVQERNAKGDVVDIFPYPEDRRLHRHHES